MIRFFALIESTLILFGNILCGIKVKKMLILLLPYLNLVANFTAFDFRRIKK
jgi:hypothetical protein